MNKSSNIYEHFQRDKKSTLTETTKFLRDHPEPQPIEQEELIDLRNKANSLVQDGKFGAAIQTLEELQDAKNNIRLHKILDPEGNTTPVLVRDARKINQSEKGPETFEMQFLNATRAGIEIAYMAEIGEDIKPLLQKQAIEFGKNISNYTATPPKKSQKDLSKFMQEGLHNLGNIMESGGIADAFKKLNTAKDFQNFNDLSYNISTISNIKVGEKKGTFIETEIGMRELTETQKADYQAIIENNKPKQPQWYTSMKPFEQALTKTYAKQITDGTHTIPTQLTQLQGIEYTNTPFNILRDYSG